jgi:hypothetical protein
MDVETKGTLHKSLPLAGRIVDLSIGGIGAFFEAGRDPELRFKETTCLRLASPRLEGDLLVPARVVRREETDGGRTYGFQILDWLGLLARLPSDMAGLFNRRGTKRVRTYPQRVIPVRVRVELPLAEFTAVLCDFSPEGVSLRAGPEALAALDGVRRVSFSFRIPGDRRHLSFSGSVRHRRLTDEGMSFGVGFDAASTPDFSEKQGILAGYAEKLRLGAFVLRVERAAPSR